MEDVRVSLRCGRGSHEPPPPPPPPPFMPPPECAGAGSALKGPALLWGECAEAALEGGFLAPGENRGLVHALALCLGGAGGARPKAARVPVFDRGDVAAAARSGEDAGDALASDGRGERSAVPSVAAPAPAACPAPTCSQLPRSCPRSQPSGPPPSAPASPAGVAPPAPSPACRCDCAAAAAAGAAAAAAAVALSLASLLWLVPASTALTSSSMRSEEPKKRLPLSSRVAIVPRWWLRWTMAEAAGFRSTSDCRCTCTTTDSWLAYLRIC